MDPETQAIVADAHEGLLELGGLIDTGPPDEGIPTEELRPFLLGWGLLASLARQAGVVVLLQRNGYTHEGAPNRRLMIEYVGHLQWLARDGADAVDSMNKALQFTQRKLRVAADRVGIPYDAEVADALQAHDIQAGLTDQYSATTRLLESLGNDFLRTGWIAETQLSHASLTTAQSFIDMGPERTQLLNEPKHKLPHTAAVAAFQYLHMGATAFNELLVGSPWGQRLEEIAATHQLQTSPYWSQDGTG